MGRRGGKKRPLLYVTGEKDGAQEATVGDWPMNHANTSGPVGREGTLRAQGHSTPFLGEGSICPSLLGHNDLIFFVFVFGFYSER